MTAPDVLYCLAAIDPDTSSHLEPCRADGCLLVARVEVFWPGQTTRHCYHHVAWGTKVAKALGFDLQTRDLDVAIGGCDSAKRFSLLELR